MLNIAVKNALPILTRQIKNKKNSRGATVTRNL